MGKMYNTIERNGGGPGLEDEQHQSREEWRKVERINLLIFSLITGLSNSKIKELVKVFAVIVSRATLAAG